MADLPPLRAPPGPTARNGNGTKLHFTIPGGALGSMAFLVVQLVGVVIWAANEHSQRLELQHNFDDFKVAMRDRARMIDMAIDRLDTVGSRQLALVTDRQNTSSARGNQMEQQLTTQLTRLNLLAELVAKQDARIDELEKRVIPPKSP